MKQLSISLNSLSKKILPSFQKKQIKVNYFDMNYLTPHSIKPTMIIGEQKMKKKAFVVPAPDAQQKLFTRPKADHTNKSREDHAERVLGQEFEGKTIGKA